MSYPIVVELASEKRSAPPSKGPSRPDDDRTHLVYDLSHYSDTLAILEELLAVS